MRIREDDLTGEATRALVASHLAGMHATSPADSVHALDVDALRDRSVTFWSAWVDDEIAGIAALKMLDASRAEIKSMRVADRYLGHGVGRAMLRHVLAVATDRGVTSLWLETGSTDDFLAARHLYASEGFVECPPFEGYSPDPFSTFMSRPL